MKNLFIPALIIFFNLGAESTIAQSLLTVGGEPVSKAEFLRAFRKNNVDSVLNEKSVREYLELFIRFKLKVKEAKRLKIDTLPSQQAELAEFKTQLTESYLYDEVSFKRLVEEARLRRQKDIHLGHIFIPTPAGSDSAFAFRRADAAYQALTNGSDFGRVAGEFSADTAVKNGDAGNITAFTLPYLFESAIYSLSPGSFTRPVRSRAGYHIFKNLGERPAVGQVRVAQILLALRPEPTPAQVKVLSARADSIFSALQNGADFNSMVQQYSDDNTSINVKGKLPVFGVGTYDPAFENAAFALKKDGGIGKPVRSTFGFHIIKRLESLPVIDNDSTRVELEQTVRRDGRMELSRDAFLKKVTAAVPIREIPYDKTAFRLKSDSIIAGYPQKTFSKNTLFTIASKPYSFDDFARYLVEVRGIASVTGEKNTDEIFRQYKEATLTTYYRENLEKYNSDYAMQLKEFREGNMLFEIMQREVWDRASRDTVGLRRYFDTHRSAYQWKPSADAVVFSALDSVSGQAVYQQLDKNPSAWRNVMLSFSDKAQADSGRFELDQLPAPVTGADIGKLTRPVANQGGTNIYSFLLPVKLYSGNTPKSFEEAIGSVVNDYQQYLEENWIRSLKTRYTVKVNEQVLKTTWK